ncbi:MAG: efflux RND transporter permease subunit [Candidatus Hydrogenedentes bacterium]|nr:efflux RND transporter permease subunit [Candidatus Hydrogenedentota bacterium]
MNLSLPRFALKHPVTVVMISISICALGVIAAYRLPLTFLPDMDFPFAGCFIPYPGATPEQVEREIAIPAEGQFRTISNIDRISSTSTSDGCQISMRFNSGTDMGLACAEIRDRIERLKLVLPEEIDRVFLHRHSSNAIPVIALGLFKAGDDADFAHLVRTVAQPRLARIDGVAEVLVFASSPEPEVLIEFDQDRLRTHNVALYQVIAMLQSSNLNFPVGNLEDGQTKFYLRVNNELSRPEAIGNLLVSPSGVRLKDVAQVGFRTRELEGHYDIDGKGGAFIIIRKESEANTVSTCKAIRQEIEQIKKDPVFAGAEEFVFFDQSEMILAALNGLIDAGKLGGILAIIILFLFLLRLRPTLIVALAIPTSLVAALVFMLFYGLNLNLVTMMSLIVAVGMLVDNAIVVLENIYRYYQMGYSPQESATRGASEVSVAITASTLTTVVVFIPVLYMENGEMAAYMKEFAFPMSASLFASLLVALTLIPLALSRMKERNELFLYKLACRILHKCVPASRIPRFAWPRFLRIHPIALSIDAYSVSLKHIMRRRLATILGIVLLLLLTALLPYRRVGLQQMPTLDMREVDITVKLDQNFNLDMAKAQFDQIKDAINQQRDELGIMNVFTHYQPEGGAMEVHLVEPDVAKPPYTTREVLSILSERLPRRLPGAELKFDVPEGGQEGSSSFTISLRMRGDDARRLADYGEQLRTVLAKVPDLTDVTVESERARQEVQIQIDAPKAESSRVTPFIIARTVDIALRGSRLPYLKQGGREFPVWAQFREENRKSRDNLDNVAVIGGLGSLVPLNQLVMFNKAESPATIERIDAKNVVTISAKIQIENLLVIQQQLQKVVDEFPLPPGYSIQLGDEFREMATNMANFATTLVMAIILIYIVMAALFESMVLPLSVLTSVPLAFVGVYWAMFICGTPLDTVGLIGCILMVGVIVNNGIVIVDHINFLRAEGRNRIDAIMQAGRDRFRPVMMTALTTILGCVPLAIVPKTGGTISFVSLGRALIGGLTVGTLLTLVVVPLLYSVIDDAREWFTSYAASLTGLGRRRSLAAEPAKTSTTSPSL